MCSRTAPFPSVTLVGRDRQRTNAIRRDSPAAPSRCPLGGITVCVWAMAIPDTVRAEWSVP